MRARSWLVWTGGLVLVGASLLLGPCLLFALLAGQVLLAGATHAPGVTDVRIAAALTRDGTGLELTAAVTLLACVSAPVCTALGWSARRQGRLGRSLILGLAALVALPPVVLLLKTGAL